MINQSNMNHFHLENLITIKLYDIINAHMDISDKKDKFISTQRELLRRLCICVKCTTDDWIAIVIYLDRLSSIELKSFLQKSNYQYILLVLVILYLKMYDDTYYDNSFYSQWTSSDLMVLNLTEERLFKCFPLLITSDQFSQKMAELAGDQGDLGPQVSVI